MGPEARAGVEVERAVGAGWAATAPAIRAARPHALWPGLVLGGALAAGAALVGPLRDVPVLDDWAYAWSVERLLAKGTWEVSAWSSHYPAVQILWGTLFAWPRGFSFGALRLSTLLLAWAGGVALYGILHRLRVGRAASLLGALTLTLNPVYFFLAHTFMTDVPYLALALAAFYCWVRGLRRGAGPWLWAGALAGLAAGLVRQPGLLLPLALLPALGRRGAGASHWRRLAPAVIALAAGGAALLAVARSLPAFEARAAALGYFLHIPGWVHLEGLLQAGLVLGLAGLPVVLGCGRLPARRTLLLLAAALLAASLLQVAHAGALPPLFAREAVWGWDELGRTRDHLPGLWEGQGPPAWLEIALTGAALLSLLLLLAGAAEGLRRWGDPRVRVVACLGALHVGLAVALWLYNDRYTLLLLPPLAILALVGWRGAAPRWAAAGPALAALALVSVLGTADALNAGEAAAGAVKDLARRGISPGEIDAGYALNGWTQFAHPEWAGAAWRGWEEVPWVFSQRPLPYTVATQPLPGGYRVLEVRTWRGWGRNHPLYVLHRPAPRPDR